MAYASHLINHSKKLGNVVSSLMRNDHASLARWLSNDSHLCADAWKVMEKRRYSSTANHAVTSFGASRNDVSRMIMKVGNPISGPLLTKDFSCSQVHWKRGFSSDSGLPPDQEIGMPSLSPTMTEGRIARWLKKEGDKISPGEVLCEVETDKTTVEMECMEEGYLAKILKGDGSKEIKLGEVTASNLLFSKQTIPHYYLTVDSCVEKLMSLRSQLNSLQEASGGKRISLNDLVIKAAALALRKVPRCNSSWTDNYIRQYNNVNINVAVQTDNGLYVPVIKDADKKGLSKISDDVKNLAQKAKENSLKPEDYEGGTFTVSNLGGPFGIRQFCAIINPPQSGILAVGSAEKRVIPGSGHDDFQ